MKTKSGISTAVAIIATLGLTSHAWGACNTTLDADDNFVTGASNTFELSGQGNFSCADLNMTEITAVVTASDTAVVSNGIDWSASEEADAVVVDPSSGNRCVYIYPDIALSGQYLTPGSDKRVSDVVVCSDGRDGFEVVEEEPVILPTTTAGDECIGDIQVDGTSVLEGGSVVIAESLDGQTRAACSVTAEDQEYCDDSCVNFRAVGETLACTTSANANGELSLTACQPCDTALDVIADGGTPPVHPVTGDPMEFCWEKVNSVYEGDDDLAGTPPAIEGVERTAGTMLRHTAVRQSEYSITWYNACYLTPIPVNGRYYWVTTCR